MAGVFAGKNIVVGVTGSIAAFKVAGWVSTLAKDEAYVSVIMTESAQKFVTPLTFDALSGNKSHCAMFGGEDNDGMAHINLGREADLLLIAPATANTIAKLASGIADDLLTTTALVTRAAVCVCPAMNSRMYSHSATKKNIKTLEELGYHVINPAEGMMACKEEGVGRLAEWEDVSEHLAKALTTQDLASKKVLVTAGPTREPMDPARFLSNRSSGKMGYAIARSAFRRGGEVTLISGPTVLPCPPGVTRIDVQSAREMYDEVLKLSGHSDIIIKTSAVADYRPAEKADHKVKKEKIKPQLFLEQNPDILYELGKRKKKGQLLVGFAAESRELQVAGRRKLEKKNLDLIAVNDISGTNCGFESENNQVLLIYPGGSEGLPHTTKQHTADLILDRIVRLIQN